MEEKELLYVSSALDPRFKSLLFLSLQEVQETYSKLLSKAVALQEEEQLLLEQPQGDTEELPHTSENNKEDCTAQSPKRRKSALLDLLGQTFKNTSSTHSESVVSVAEKEIKQYQNVPSLPLTEDPLLWWKSQEHVYPLLSKLAQMHLCIPGTSVAAERVFSTAGDVISIQRSLLTPEHADQLIFLKKNLHM